MNIIAVDFDNTLALGNFARIERLLPNIPLINKLKRSGCYIKIVTARGGKRKLTEEQKKERYYDSIKQWLERNEVPFNQISFNKEYAHLYIDDMTIDEHANFETIRSEFTNNSIIFTERTCIKNCSTAQSEFAWYALAKANQIAVPEVLFCNDELIVTRKIKEHRKPKAEDLIQLLRDFSGMPPINKAEFTTYIDNLSGFEIPDLRQHAPTFYHGDFSTQNVLVSDKCYCIDPNFKNVFGSAVIDAGKAAFSFYAYEKNLHAAGEIWKEYPESIPFTITEGMRVCKYRDYFSELQNLRTHLKI